MKEKEGKTEQTTDRKKKTERERINHRRKKESKK